MQGTGTDTVPYRIMIYFESDTPRHCKLVSMLSEVRKRIMFFYSKQKKFATSTGTVKFSWRITVGTYLPTYYFSGFFPVEPFHPNSIEWD